MLAGDEVTTPEWFERARCRELGVPVDVFFPALTEVQAGAWINAAGERVDRGHNEEAIAAVALEVCAGCAVRVLCLNYALDEGEIHGVWGGMAPRARRELMRDRRARGIR